MRYLLLAEFNGLIPSSTYQWAAAKIKDTFSIYGYTRLLVTDSTFEGIRKTNNRALYADTSVRARFTNCAFTKNILILKGRNGELVYLERSKINNITNADHPIFFAYENCKLYITETEVSHGRVQILPLELDQVQPFIYFKSSCVVVLDRCLFSGNVMPGNVQALYNTNVSSFNSTFVSNEYIHELGMDFFDTVITNESKWGILDVIRGFIVVKDSSFTNNTALTGTIVRGDESTMELIGNTMEGNSIGLIQATSSNITITASTFLRNHDMFDDCFKIRSHLHRYHLKLYNCIFENNDKKISVFGYHELNIQNTIFNNKLFMEISNVPISRISCSTFYSDQPGSINLKITKNPDYPVDSVLWTFNSSFSNEDLSIKSNSNNYLKILLERGIIKTANQYLPTHQESEYASGEY